jgi:hypothetical protein
LWLDWCVENGNDASESCLSFEGQTQDPPYKSRVGHPPFYLTFSRNIFTETF